MKKSLIFYILTILTLAGCAPTVRTPPCANHYAAAIDSSLRGQSNQFSGDLYDCQMRERMKTITTSTLTGLTLGAGIGAITAELTRNDPVLGGVIGGAAGAAGGWVYGKFAADRDDAADQVAIAEQAFGILQRENQNLANYIAQARDSIEKDNKKLKAIKKQLRRHKISRKKAESEIQKLNETKVVLQSAVVNLKKRREQAAQSIPKNNQQFTAEMQRYDAQIGELEQIAAQIPERTIKGRGWVEKNFIVFIKLFAIVLRQSTLWPTFGYRPF